MVSELVIFLANQKNIQNVCTLTTTVCISTILLQHTTVECPSISTYILHVCNGVYAMTMLGFFMKCSQAIASA